MADVDPFEQAARAAEAVAAFETTIVTTHLPDANRVNAALRDTVLAHMEEDAGVQRSNVAGWQSAPDMLTSRWAGPAAFPVVHLALATANRYSIDLKMKDEPRFEWTADMWANVSGPGASNNWHAHPQAFWSAVYYVDAGGAGDDVGGELVFQDPRYPMNRMFSSDLVFRSPDGAPQETTRVVKPQSGMLVAFPSWLFHKVQPYRGSGQRISLAINMTVMPARGEDGAPDAGAAWR